ncbi:MAG: AAA family ATPase [Deltaproteobacteria bacterium]|nr:AAA family ATPase [Deltaproteobacteria bacterium]
MRPERYESFYELAENPFSLTPDPRFLFRSKGHHDVLQAVLYGLETGKGIIAIIGEVGTGKTTLCRSLLRLLPEKFKRVLSLDPHLSVTGLLRTIVEGLGVSAERPVYFSLMSALQNFLIQAAERGESPVIILDEAQRLSRSVLEQIRILSNLETATGKLLQIVLVGQTELEERLLRQDLRQLNQRIAVRCYLDPLSRRETFTYIEHRLRLAGLSRANPFTRPALRRIWAHSKGIPRIINLLCDRALTAGCMVGSRTIGASLVAKATESLGRPPRPSHFSVRPSLALAGLVVGLLGGGISFWQRDGVESVKQLNLFHRAAVEIPAAAKDASADSQTPELKPSTGSQAVDNPDPAFLLKKLLDLWGIKVIQDKEAWPMSPDGSLDVRLIAARHGLEALRLDKPSWSEIEAVGLPAVVEWEGENQPHLLIRVSDDSVMFLAAGGREERRPLEQVQREKLRSGWLLWLNGDGWTSLPTAEWTGRLITLFAARLNALGYLSYPLPAKYDERLKTAISQFQRKTRLSADGVLGPRTAMALVRVTGGEGIPRLYNEDEVAE